MSRTHHHGGRSLKKRWICFDKHSDQTPPKKKRHYTPPHHFWMHTPGWWTRLTMTRPQRQEVRRLITQLSRLPDIADAPLFPLARKPFIYFW